MSHYVYLITPFLAWLCAGCSKFAINSIKAKKAAFKLIGYGGMPSNHSAIVSSMMFLIALKNGIEHPAFGAALTLAFIVMMDANSLRKQMEKHAKAINVINQNQVLRERLGHTKPEILGGCVVGFCVAFIMSCL